MTKSFFTIFMLLSASLSTADPVVWNSRNGLEKWRAKANVKVVCDEDVLKLTDIGRDPQVISPEIDMDASAYDNVSITYRGRDIPPSAGQLFYSHGKEICCTNTYWRIPPLTGDGKWHTVTLDSKALLNANSWFRGGPVKRLRLDPCDAPGGTLEIKEIKFFKSK